ncbi:MAG: tetratricopeptide repeat protein [Bacteroidota bacterium]|nr:tetratricopeptide repeat protein [Bacteroidota bacterium]MDP3146128.1 tetratricopeptide repeat protein [Bacteroidota bacterium]
MARFFWIFIFLWIGVNLFSQNPERISFKLDSLRQELKANNQDTTISNIWMEIGNIYQGIKPDSAIFFHTKAIEYAVKGKSQLKKGENLRFIGYDYIYLRDNENASKFFDEGLRIAEKEIELSKDKKYIILTKKLQSSCLAGIGVNYKSLGNSDKAMEYFEKALKINLEINNVKGQINIYGNIGGLFQAMGQNDKALENMLKGLKLSEEINSKNNISILCGNIGLSYKFLGVFSKAIVFYERALKIDEELENKNGISRHLVNIASIYKNQGNYSKSLEYSFKALKISEEAENIKNQAAILGEIAVLYNIQSQNNKAESYYLQSLKKYEEINDKRGISNQLGNLGICYMQVGDSAKKKKNKILANLKYNQALEYYFKALKTDEELKDAYGMGCVYGNIALLYKAQDFNDKALEYYLKSIECFEKTDIPQMAAQANGNLGSFYTELKKYDLAEKYIEKSLNIAKKIGAFIEIKFAHQYFYNLFEKTNRPAKALEHYKLFKEYEDSLFNIENTKASIEQEMKFGFEKKTAADSIKVVAEKEIVAAQLKQEKTQRYALYIGLFLVVVFALFIFNRFKVTQRQKAIIELKEKETHFQKEIIQEKHKEITDSINYAERIQKSFLATKELLDENLNEYFILFKPKDVVSGDFYWGSILLNGNFAFVTADSTGHGVPGAIMSLLNITSLEKAIETSSNPTEILNLTRKNIIERLKKDGSIEGGKDGMDCSLISFNKNKTKLEIAAAHNPVWIIRNNEVIEIKPDKMPVGKHDRDSESFTIQEFDLQKGDVIYTLTDGFPDQFGGDKGKKYMSKNLKELLKMVSQKSMKEQQEILENTFAEWVGNLEQVDDVTLIGVRV